MLSDTPAVIARTPMACGTWPSPVTSDAVAGKVSRPSELRVDGQAILWLESRPEEKGRSTLLRWQGGSDVRELTPAPLDIGSRVHEYGGGAYAAQHGSVVASSRTDGHVLLFAADGSQQTLCAVEGLRFADFAFLPDGRHVVCVREDHRATGEPRAAIVALSLTPDKATRAGGTVLVEGPDFLSSPRPSPDGSHLAWIAWNHPAMPWERTTLMCATMQNAAGMLSLSAPHPLSEGCSTIAPFWDGARLIASTDRNGWWTLTTFDAQGSKPLFTTDAEIGGPHWVFGEAYAAPLGAEHFVAQIVDAGQARTVILHDGSAETVDLGHPAQCPLPLQDGQFAWIDAPPHEPPSVVTGPVGGPFRRLSALPFAFDPAEISRAQPISFPTEGGGSAHAFFYAPTSAVACVPQGEKPPLVVMSHGGPTARADTGFALKVQWWTSRGFAVVDVNYGGSTGFGRAYRERLDGQWGERDVADCVAACTWLIAQGRVDPARIVIRGSSAGGMTVLNALARADAPFAAGTSLYGVTDLASLAQETHKFEARYLDGLIGPWPEAQAVYHDRSPLTRAGHIQVPVLFLHGTDDMVVPIAQARSMAAKLRNNDVPVAVREFPGERHGFRNAATLRTAFESELAFYGSVLGFVPAGLEGVEIPFLP